MKVTPLDIRQQQFAVRFRGFDQAEVDTFLELVASEVEELVKENTRLKEGLAKKDQDLQRMHDGEDELKKALMAIHQIKEDWVGRAEIQATQILTDAESRSRQIVTEAERRLEALQHHVEELKRQRYQLVLQMRSILEQHLKLLEEEEHRESRSEVAQPLALEPPDPSSNPRELGRGKDRTEC